MKVEISVPEVVSVFKEIQEQPERIFEMIRMEIRENVGTYLSRLMVMELTRFLGRERYEHGRGDIDHRNGSYGRHFTLKGIGEVNVEVPRDRKVEFKTQVIPRSKRYESELRQDLSMMSEHLIGRRISLSEVSNANNGTCQQLLDTHC